MRDYEAVLKQARTCANQKYCDLGGNCEYYDLDVCCQGGEKDILKDAAGAIEELQAAVPKWISVEERLPERTNPLHARDTYLVRLESGCIKTLFYEYDNSDRCRPGMSPLFSEGWEKTAVPVTHWMPLPAPPKEELNKNVE